MKEKNNKKIYIALIIIFAIFFIVFTCLVVKQKTFGFNKSVYENIISFKNNGITSFLKTISVMGDKIFLTVLIIILLIFMKNKNISILLAVGTLGQAIINVITKKILQIPRPKDIALIAESGFGYPSGHAMASMFFYGYVIYLINKFSNKRWIKVTANIILPVLVLLIGTSRIYLGVHSASDIVAGYTLSFIVLMVSILVSNKTLNNKEKNTESK